MADQRPIVVITGASRGIGAATAVMASARGYDVAVNYRSGEVEAADIVASCRAAGGRAVAIRGDMAIEADVIALFDAVAVQLGPVRHVVNNAGVTGLASPLAKASAETIRSTIDINVTGAILVAREAARRLVASGQGGSLVNISSVAATLGSPGEYVWYAASKAAIDALTIGLSKELAGDHVRVNAVSPGLTVTDLHARSTGEPGRVERIAPQIPMRRGGQPEEIAEAILFLMSDGASYVTGANIKVSGGR